VLRFYHRMMHRYLPLFRHSGTFRCGTFRCGIRMDGGAPGILCIGTTVKPITLSFTVEAIGGWMVGLLLGWLVDSVLCLSVG